MLANKYMSTHTNYTYPDFTLFFKKFKRTMKNYNKKSILKTNASFTHCFSYIYFKKSC